MYRHVPNAITAARMGLAIVFFWMLSYYQYEVQQEATYLNLAFMVYLLALITDFFDGYLARKWHVEGAFGRMVDPFVDKVLVLGSFICFAGKNFVIPQNNPLAIPQNVQTITGVAPWMVVVILARELLVTTLRGANEGGGNDFGAKFSGKLKMVVQSITILAILAYVNYLHPDHPTWHPAIRKAGIAFRDTCIWGTIIITVISGMFYVRRAIGLYRGRNTADAAGKEC